MTVLKIIKKHPNYELHRKNKHQWLVKAVDKYYMDGKNNTLCYKLGFNIVNLQTYNLYFLALDDIFYRGCSLLNNIPDVVNNQLVLYFNKFPYYYSGDIDYTQYVKGDFISVMVCLDNIDEIVEI